MEYENKFILFMDLLGFSQAVMESEMDEELTKGLIELVEKFKDEAKNSFMDNSYTFSDTVISVIDYDEKNDYTSFVEILLSFYSMALKSFDRQFYIRGGLTFGHVYCNKGKDIIVGPALIRAYELEKKARFPRIILDELASEKLSKHINLIDKDPDGYTILDFSNPVELFDYGATDRYLTDNQSHITLCLEKF